MVFLEIFFAVETDDFGNLVDPGLDVGEGIGQQVNRDQVIGLSKVRKPD